MFIDKLKRLVNPALADSLLAHSATEGTGVIPLDDLPKLLNAGNLKMPGSDISIADYYRYMSGKQILINADFSNKKLIVNQRMQDEYTRTGYTVDMWALRGSCKLQLLSDGLKVISVGDNSNNFPSINQFIENFGALAGKTVTCSVLIDELNLADDCTCTFAAWDTDTFLSHTNPIGATSGITKPGLYTFTVKVKDTLAKGCLVSLRLNTPQENSWFKVRAIKVEINDHQTLAHREGDQWILNDPPPNYALELAKCQRYLMPFGGAQTYLADAGAGGKSPRVYLSKNFYKFRAKPTLTKASFSNTTFMGSDHYFYNKAATLVDITEFDDSYLVTFSMPDIEGFTSNAIGGFSMSDQNVFLSAEL